LKVAIARLGSLETRPNCNGHPVLLRTPTGSAVLGHVPFCQKLVSMLRQLGYTFTLGVSAQ